MIQEVGDSVALPVAEGGHRGQDGRNVFRRVHPGQRQQAADAEGQLEGRFPFSGGSCGNDDSVVLGDLAQAGDQEFPADDNDGDPEWAQSGGRQGDESRGDGYFIRQGVNELAEGGDLVQAACQIAVQPVRARGQHKDDQRGRISPGMLGRQADDCREDDHQRDSRQGNGIRQIQHMRILGRRWSFVASVFCILRELILSEGWGRKRQE